MKPVVSSEDATRCAHPLVPLPAVVHRVAELPATARVVVVGDVHACADELQLLLRACAFNAARDTLVLVGDLVNKGPKPVEVVRFAREANALCVRGNHDDAALAAYYAWRTGGGARDASDSKYRYVEQLSPEDVRFLEELPFTLTLPAQNAIVVHAGLVPGVPLHAQRPLDMYKMRFIEPVDQDGGIDEPVREWAALETRAAAREAGQLFQWATQWRGPQHVFFGHDAVPGLQREAFATGLDTGCCYGRQLTACILPAREIVQVQALRAYAPAANDGAVNTAGSPATPSSATQE
ncbi:hypothetical protein PybrP1_011993 [[Pythium] brassicae (nom. inval.)]|nr:hypothetical protein PybrP1_011993 [[Pythium] brassicae (nom. inval.)]